MAELSGKSTVIKVSGVGLTLTNEATTETGDQVYQITNPVKQVIDPLTAVVVKEDGTATTETYTINYMNGKVTFDTVDALRGVVTVTGKYLPMTTVAYANKLSTSRKVDISDVTRFGDDYKRRITGLKFASGTLSQFDMLDTYFEDALLAGLPVVMEDRATSVSEPNRYWALLESRELALAIADPVNESVSWISTDEFITLGQ